jgi:hypothetical protein
MILLDRAMTEKISISVMMLMIWMRKEKLRWKKMDQISKANKRQMMS